MHEVVMYVYNREQKHISEYGTGVILSNKYTVWLLKVRIKLDFNTDTWI